MRIRTSALAALVTVAACADSSGPGPVATCAAGVPVSLAVAAYSSIDPSADAGCVAFAANTSADSIEYLVLPWSDGGVLGASALFNLASATPAAVAAPALTAATLPTPNPTGARGAVAVTFDHYLRELARSRNYAVPPRAPAVAGVTPQPSPTGPPTVGSKRSFKVCSNTTCSAFDNVGGVVRAVGMHIAIYVDTLAPSPGLSDTDLTAIQDEFDNRLYDVDTTTFGPVSDIDGNSVVIVLMSNTVNKLVSKAQCASDGAYIAGFFFSGDLDPSFSTQFNNGEIFYSIVADPNATLSCAHRATDLRTNLPVTFVHEFQHMISFVQHVRVHGGNSEETWLDEGMSRYAEEAAGRTFLPGDRASFSTFAIDPIIDAYKYLQSPGTAALLFAADTGGLEPLGAGWLLVRYMVDQFGDSLPRRLVQGALTGRANIEARTGQPFEQTLTRWSLANWVSDLPNFSAPPELHYTSWQFRTTFDTLYKQAPATFPVPFPLVPPVSAPNAVSLSGRLLAGSGYYQRVIQAPGAPAFALRLAAPTGSPVSAAAVPRLHILRIR